MKLPWDIAARYAGGVFGLLLGIAALFAISGGKGGIRCSRDTVWIPGPVVTVPIHRTDIEAEKVHYGIPFQVLTKLDSLTSEIRKRDSVLATTLEDLRRPRKFQWQWDVKKDSTAIYGMAVLDWCPENGLMVHAVTVDSLSTPSHILKIIETVVVPTGVDWYWLPIIAVIAFAIGWLV